MQKQKLKQCPVFGKFCNDHIVAQTGHNEGATQITVKLKLGEAK